MGLLDPNSAAYQDALQNLQIAPTQQAQPQPLNRFTPETFRREGDYGTRDKYDDYRRDSRQGVASFQNQAPPPTEYTQPEKVLPGIFGDWGTPQQWDGLLSMPKNNFQYESQGFNYTPQEFNYTPQTFTYEPQPFTYEPYNFGVK